MSRIRPFVFRAISFSVCFGLLNLCMPMSVIVQVGTPVREKVEQKLAENAAKAKELAKRRAASASRELTAKEQTKLQGSQGENPYLAGQTKWDVIYKGVNLMTGNFTTTATDMSFDGGYGIPVNVTRSYSANQADEGPFGKGWTLSADVRNTAGGLIKSSRSPVRAVPVQMNERPSAEADPNVTTQPIAAVTSTDAGGKEETIQRDVDGVLTTPPWDNNTSEPQYEWKTLGDGSVCQLLTANKVTTPDGTVYVYAKQGAYPNGTHPLNAAGPIEQANVLKVMSATDRQGNVTTYTYGSQTVQFAKTNGLVQEHPLVGVQMPNGHAITFTWGDGSTGHPTNRVWKVKDNGDVRVVTYGYDVNGLLTSVTTPGGKTTTYGYGSTVTAGASGLLTTITGPNNLTTTISYMMATFSLAPYGASVTGPVVYRVQQPNDYRLYVQMLGNNLPASDSPFRPAGPPVPGISKWVEIAGAPSGYIDSCPSIGYFLNSADGSVMIEASGTSITPITSGEVAAGVWYKTYSLTTLNLLMQRNYTYQVIGRGSEIQLAQSRQLLTQNVYETVQKTTSSYNFMGNPLWTQNQEGYTQSVSDGITYSRTAQVDYSYWGKDKYYQQKAVRDQAQRFSFTDYYPDSRLADGTPDPAANGKRGQTYRVYDPKNSQFTNTGGTGWKSTITPFNPNAYSAQFQYDSKGRPTDVWKLQKTTTSPWSYVQTHTTYGADQTPEWGQAKTVVEDYGGINRTTTTNAYTTWGKACDVTDAAGHRFVTNYDPDGRVKDIRDGNGNLVADYQYCELATDLGTPRYGQVRQVTDHLSGVIQVIDYATSGGGIGQPSQVSESGGPNPGYSVSYTYTSAGDRNVAMYSTPNGNTTWQYADYISVGDPCSPSRAFQTLRQLTSGGGTTANEFHYSYDSAGKLQEAAFAQTPTAGYVPTGTNPYYDASHLASSRARAHYEYDPGGRITTVAYYWDTLNGGGTGYTSETVVSNSCDYEISGANRGLKTANRIYTQSAPHSQAWSLSETDTYGYDGQLDYLTSESYSNGGGSGSLSWSYDAAGNRNDSVCDNLNRATSVGGVACTNDILGNRLSKGGDGYCWDQLNRLVEFDPGGFSYDHSIGYTYRADGMRTRKDIDQGASGSTIYRYDGQMGMQDVELDGSGVLQKVTDYALGARGIDAMSVTSGASNQVSYPLYDAHGNMISTLTKSGNGGYAYTALRTFDAWGNVRLGAQTGDPKGRYCGNLGHKQDDESGLIYMRTRYYEPYSGRFVSEDFGKSGFNWYSYCSSDPVNRLDRSGKIDGDSAGELVKIVWHTIESLPDILKALGGFSAFLVQRTIKALMKSGMAAVGAWVANLSTSLISRGVDQFMAGAAEFAYASSAGSFSQTMGWGAKGTLDMIVGVSEMAAGLAMKYVAAFIIWSN